MLTNGTCKKRWINFIIKAHTRYEYETAFSAQMLAYRNTNNTLYQVMSKSIWPKELKQLLTNFKLMWLDVAQVECKAFVCKYTFQTKISLCIANLLLNQVISINLDKVIRWFFSMNHIHFKHLFRCWYNFGIYCYVSVKRFTLLSTWRLVPAGIILYTDLLEAWWDRQNKVNLCSNIL